MPYIITTTRRVYRDGDMRHQQPVKSRRAVATLEEDDLRRECKRAQPAMIFSAERMEQIRSAVESGGTVSPLPDGTVIEVEHVKWDELRDRIPHALEYDINSRGRAIIDAYNAREGS